MINLSPSSTPKPITLNELMQMGVQYHQNGQLQEAEQCYRKILEVNPNQADALHLLGVIGYQVGQFAPAEHLIREAININPNVADYHEHFGMVMQAQSRVEAAINHYERALQINPAQFGAINNLGTLYQELEEWDNALKYYEKARQLSPAHPTVYNNLGKIQSILGNFADAEKNYQIALQVAPQFAETYRNLGNLRLAQNQWQAAREAYQQALQLDGSDIDAYSGFARASVQIGQLEEAYQAYKQLLLLKPAHLEARHNIGVVLQGLNRLEEAANYYQQALLFTTDEPIIYTNLGRTLGLLGKIDEARKMLNKALEIDFNHSSTRINLALLTSPIIPAAASITSERENLERDLKDLLNSELNVENPLAEISSAGFYLAYRGLNDKPIKQLLAQLHQKACPALNFIATHCQSPINLANRKIRIGFVDRFNKDDVVTTFIQGVIAQLDRERFTVNLFFLNLNRLQTSSELVQLADSVEYLSENTETALYDAQRQIAAQNLDILVYPSIGDSSGFTYFLSFARLAHLQCTMRGFPVTTGVPNVDYFLSSHLMEIPEADEHYTEKLIRFNSLGIYYPKFSAPSPLKNRAELHLPLNGNLYVCTQSLFKYHPDFDKILTDILHQDTAAEIVLFEGHYSAWTTLLKQRFNQTIPSELQNRIHILPRYLRKDYFNIIALADVMLDTPHFGGGNTTFDAFAIGTPIVTLPTTYMRGRATVACYQRMGITDCIAKDLSDYARIAVTIATDKTYQSALKARILAQHDVLFNNVEVMTELENFFTQTLERANT